MNERRFFLRWLWTVSLGETAGFLLPAVVGVSTASSGSLSFPFVVSSGAVEGAILGWSQWLVLRHRLPDLSGKRWILLTAVGAVLAYVIGLAPSTFAALWQRWPVGVQVGALILLAVILLGSIGFTQWLELRHWIMRAYLWMPITALAWALALGVFLGIATPLWHAGQPPAEAIAVGVVAGLAMAIAMAAVTGIAMSRLSRPVELIAGRNVPAGTGRSHRPG